MATATTPKLTDKVFTLLETLDTEQLGQVIDFMEFLKAKKAQSNGDSFVTRITREADPSVKLEQVRARLSAIKGNLSDVITQEREERL
jgi:hypothetical protein